MEIPKAIVMIIEKGIHKITNFLLFVMFSLKQQTMKNLLEVLAEKEIRYETWKEN